MTKDPKKDTKKTYQQMKQELDELLAWFERGDIDIDQALEKYESGQKLVKELESYLSKIEQKIIKK